MFHLRPLSVVCNFATSASGNASHAKCVSKARTLEGRLDIQTPSSRRMEAMAAIYESCAKTERAILEKRKRKKVYLLNFSRDLLAPCSLFPAPCSLLCCFGNITGHILALQPPEVCLTRLSRLSQRMRCDLWPDICSAAGRVCSVCPARLC